GELLTFRFSYQSQPGYALARIVDDAFKQHDEVRRHSRDLIAIEQIRVVVEPAVDRPAKVQHLKLEILSRKPPLQDHHLRPKSSQIESHSLAARVAPRKRLGLLQNEGDLKQIRTGWIADRLSVPGDEVRRIILMLERTKNRLTGLRQKLFERRIVRK